MIFKTEKGNGHDNESNLKPKQVSLVDATYGQPI